MVNHHYNRPIIKQPNNFLFIFYIKLLLLKHIQAHTQAIRLGHILFYLQQTPPAKEK